MLSNILCPGFLSTCPTIRPPMATLLLCALRFPGMFTYGFIFRFKEDIKFMLGQQPERYWVVCWRFIVPSCIVAITGFSLYQLIETGISYTVYNKAKVWRFYLDFPWPSQSFFRKVGSDQNQATMIFRRDSFDDF